MKKYLCISIVLLYGFGRVPATAYDEVRALARHFPLNTQVSIGIIDHGKKFYVGFTKTKSGLVLVDNRDKIFAIASLTKLFTSTLVACMVNDKKISLQDEIGRFYPFKIRYAGGLPPVTIGGLCTHSSGLPKDAPTGLEAYLKSKIQLSHEGGKYRYSNLGFMILEKILVKTSGKNYRGLLTEKVLIPMKMNSTSVDLQNVSPARVVKGRDVNGVELENKTSYAYEGVGSLKSNATDLLHFLDLQFFKQSHLHRSFVLTQEALVKVNASESMGMGWHILYTNHDAVYHHSGYLEGYTAEIRHALKRQRGVVVLSNISGSGPYAGDIEKIAKACLALE